MATDQEGDGTAARSARAGGRHGNLGLVGRPCYARGRALFRAAAGFFRTSHRTNLARVGEHSSGPSSRALAQALAEADGILFLCSGNMVRSTFAELYARHLGLALPLASAATRFRNRGMYPETHAALLRRGVAARELARFRSRHLDDLDAPFARRALVFGMRSEHLQAACTRGATRTFLLGALLEPPAEIPDPVLEGADFEATFADLARAVERLVALYGSVTSTSR